MGHRDKGEGGAARKAGPRPQVSALGPSAVLPLGKETRNRVHPERPQALVACGRRLSSASLPRAEATLTGRAVRATASRGLLSPDALPGCGFRCLGVEGRPVEEAFSPGPAECGLNGGGVGGERFFV